MNDQGLELFETLDERELGLRVVMAMAKENDPTSPVSRTNAVRDRACRAATRLRISPMSWEAILPTTRI